MSLLWSRGPTNDYKIWEKEIITSSWFLNLTSLVNSTFYSQFSLGFKEWSAENRKNRLNKRNNAAQNNPTHNVSQAGNSTRGNRGGRGAPRGAARGRGANNANSANKNANNRSHDVNLIAKFK